MNSLPCNCGPLANPIRTIETVTHDYGTKPIKKGNGFALFDDNGNIRPSYGYGVAFCDGNTCYMTDGSPAQGPILLNPSPSLGVDAFLGLSGGRLFAIGGTTYGEGTILIFKGGQWVASPLSERTLRFDPSTLRTGGKQLLSFGCSNGDTVELALFQQKPNTVLVFDENSEARTYTLEEFFQASLVAACSSIPSATDEDEISGIVSCSERGLVKAEAGVTKTYYADPMVEIYAQVRTVSLPGTDLNPGEVLYYPNLPPVQTGAFADQLVDFDITKLPGYKDTATGILLSVRGALGIQSASGVEVWHMVAVINGRERLRITSGQGAGWNSDGSQFVAAIPESKTLRIDVQRQIALAGAASEVAYCVVYFEGFLFN